MNGSGKNPEQRSSGRSKVASYRRGSEAAGRHDGEGRLFFCAAVLECLVPRVLPEFQVAVPDIGPELRLLSAVVLASDVSSSLMAPTGNGAA